MKLILILFPRIGLSSGLLLLGSVTLVISEKPRSGDVVRMGRGPFVMLADCVRNTYLRLLMFIDLGGSFRLREAHAQTRKTQRS